MWATDEYGTKRVTFGDWELTVWPQSPKSVDVYHVDDYSDVGADWDGKELTVDFDGMSSSSVAVSREMLVELLKFEE